MSSHASPTAPAVPDNYLGRADGLGAWLFSLDHKRIGVMYLVSILTMFLFGGIMALQAQTEMLTPGQTLMPADEFARVQLMSGMVMVFLFIIPAIPAALGNFVLPLMLGTANMALPGLNRTGFHLYLLGAVLGIVSMAMSGSETGWTALASFEAGGGAAILLLSLSVFILGLSSMFTSLNIIVTIHRRRPAGTDWLHLPVFAWSLYAASAVLLVTTPVSGVALVLLAMERLLGLSILDPALGGNAALYGKFFWFLSHPAALVMVLPAMGLVSELISVFSRKPVFGFRMVSRATVSVAALGVVAWAARMFDIGQSALLDVIVSALTLLLAIPLAVLVFSWIGTMYKGSVRTGTAMLYALIFIIVFGLGGLSGLFLTSLGTTAHLEGTDFAVAQFNYLLLGGTLFAFLAGLHHWWPKITGRMFDERAGNTAAVVTCLGFNLAHFPRFIMGSQGLPQHLYDAGGRFELYQQISTVGCYVVVVGLLMAATVLVRSLRSGAAAPANPWGGASLEWRAASPPTCGNFDGDVDLPDPYDYEAVPYDAAAGAYVRTTNEVNA